MTDIEKYFFEAVLFGALIWIGAVWIKKEANKSKDNKVLRKDVQLLELSESMIKLREGSNTTYQSLVDVNILTFVLFNGVGEASLKWPLGKKIHVDEKMLSTIKHLFEIFTPHSKEHKWLLRDIARQDHSKLSLVFDDALEDLETYYQVSGFLNAMSSDKRGLEDSISKAGYAAVEPYLKHLQDIHKKIKIKSMLKAEAADMG